MVMSVRDIRQVFDSYDKLDCEKVYFKGFTEDELVYHINDFVSKSYFENYFITSDDCMISKERFDLLKYYLNYNPIVSGWGLFGQQENFTTIIPTNKTNKLNNHNPVFCDFTLSFLVENCYKTYQIDDLPNLINSSFTGWFFTGAKKNIWSEYPFQTFAHPSSRSDLNFSFRVLRDKKYNQLIVKSCRCIHMSNAEFQRKYKFNTKEIIKTF